ncbi:hypothetical protein JOB18_018871 [Solea senegalensis]|uniref:Uncharacterized protein n=1 Tax=Solea senegalensis TaxID=28829 RepID=A0AAV6RPK5_SOLSE|nr:hypothetical protein JOB18_018871 [Solea senegalensis]
MCRSVTYTARPPSNFFMKHIEDNFPAERWSPCPAAAMCQLHVISIKCGQGLSIKKTQGNLWLLKEIPLAYSQPCYRLQEGSSICDEEVSSWLGPHGVVQAAARWSIIYYRTSLLLLRVTNALRSDGLPEVNAARLTPVPSDKHCQCLIWKSSSSVKYQ